MVYVIVQIIVRKGSAIVQLVTFIIVHQKCVKLTEICVFQETQQVLAYNALINMIALQHLMVNVFLCFAYLGNLCPLTILNVKFLPNFVLKDGLCVSTFCLTYENRTGFVFPQCISCQSGYTPWSNYCIPKNCNSTTYNLTSGLCASCSGFGFTLSPDRKSCIVANC